MPRFRRTIPDLRRVGPVLPVRIEQVLAVQEILRAEGSPVPSVSVLALLDTGASGTTIQSSVLEAFDIQPVGRVFFSTPSTIEPQIRRQYRLRVALSPGIGFETDVAKAPLGGHHIQCLIGRDILEQCVLSYNGPKNQFTLNVMPTRE